MVCEPGTYSNQQLVIQSSDCTPVADGFSSNTITGYESPTMNREDCEPGYYCDNQAKTPAQKDKACAPGTYCAGQNTAEVPCAAGYITFNY